MLVTVFVVLFFLMLALGLPLFPNVISFVELAGWSVAKTMNATGVPIVLFIIAGQVMSSGKLTEEIYDVFNYFLGAKTGFMPIVCILTAMFYSSISGSATAVTAAVGGMCLPHADRDGL